MRKIQTAHLSEVTPKKPACPKKIKLSWVLYVFGATSCHARKTKKNYFRQALNKSVSPSKHACHATVILSLHHLKLETARKLLASIDLASHSFLLLPLCPITRSPASSCLSLPCSHWDARSGAPGSWPRNKRSPCAALFAQRGVFLQQRRFTALPCGSHLRVCALALAFLFGNALKFVRPLNPSTVPAHSSPHRCICVCVCVRVCFPAFLLCRVCVCACVQGSVYCAELCMYRRRVAPGLCLYLKPL